jgi:hypothetical protein
VVGSGPNNPNNPNNPNMRTGSWAQACAIAFACDSSADPETDPWVKAKTARAWPRPRSPPGPVEPAREGPAGAVVWRGALPLPNAHAGG